MRYLITIPLATAAVLLSCTTTDTVNPNMVADMDPVSVGMAEAEFDKMFSSKLEKSEIEAIFYPRLNSVALKFRYQAITYRQFWDLAARTDFVTALERYKSDYEDRNLDDKYRKTKAIYGKTKGRVEWEAFKIAKTRSAHTSYEIGYRFKEKRPFFTILMLSGKEEKSESSPMSSQQITMYFTRAQAEELAALFDQLFLLKMIGMQDQEDSGQDSGDKYDEWDP
jgi:hypothetical protein